MKTEIKDIPKKTKAKFYIFSLRAGKEIHEKEVQAETEAEAWAKLDLQEGEEYSGKFRIEEK